MGRLRRPVPTGSKGSENLLAALIFVLVMASAWALFHLFSARAAFIHVGAMIGTIMVANVFFHIIPGQKRMVADIRAGRAPDPKPGIIGKQRSVHNTYFTLPVLFIMISNHYPMTYSHPHGWLVLGVIMLAGVLIRQFFVLRHRGSVKWALPAAGVALLAGVAVALAPRPVDTAGAKVAFAKVRGGDEGALRLVSLGTADAGGLRAAAERRDARNAASRSPRTPRKSRRPSATSTCRSAT